MPTVYVPHLSTKYDEQTGRRVPTKDISKAAAMGHLEIVLETPGCAILHASVQAEIKQTMSEFKEGDYLLAIGDPVAIALCAIEAAKRVNSINFLKWDRAAGMYLQEQIKVK